MPKRNLFGKLERYFIFLALIRCTIMEKCIFSHTSGRFFSLGVKFLRFSCFRECGFERDQRSHLKMKPFEKSFWYGGFRYVSALCKNVFSAAPVKYLFSLGLKWLSFSCFREYPFGRDQKYGLYDLKTKDGILDTLVHENLYIMHA